MDEKLVDLLDEKLIVEAITKSEEGTSGEIRVHIAKSIHESALDDAAETFANLNLHLTKYRNGVLIFISEPDHEFAIIGDKGINRVVKSNFWKDQAQNMRAYFRNKTYTEGIVDVINNIGFIFDDNFPYDPDAQDQIPNEISYEN